MNIVAAIRKVDGHHPQTGVAYVAILLALLILTTIGFAFLFTIRTELSTTIRRGSGMQAQYLAEAAANHAMWRLLHEAPPEATARVSAANDDAEEHDGGSMVSGAPGTDQLDIGKMRFAGVRFPDVPIPQGATVLDAYVEFTACEPDNQPTGVLVIGQSVDDAPPFLPNPFNISTRTPTAASVVWSEIPEWTQGESVQTPDLTPIIQEIVDRPGWSSGNAMVIVFVSTDLTGRRRACAYEYSPASAAELHIGYEGGPLSSDAVYHMHSFGGGRYGYKVRRHTHTTFATIATVGAFGDNVVHQSYVLNVLPPRQDTCVAQYIETHEPWSAGAEGSWEVMDLSVDPFNVPPRAVLEVAITNDKESQERRGGVRSLGSTLERGFDLHEAEGYGVDAIVMHVQADANSRIEHYSEEKSHVGFILLGYWTCAHYAETFDMLSAGAAGSWQDHGLGPQGVAPAQVAELVVINENAVNERRGGARTDGSGLDSRRLTLHEAEPAGDDGVTTMVMAGADGDATIELYAEDDADIEFYLVGYWSTAPGTYTESQSLLIGPIADQTWQDADMSPYGVPAHAVAQIAMENSDPDQEKPIGLRQKGSTLQRKLELHEAEDGGADIASVHVNADADSMIEGYCEDVTGPHAYRLLGYWQLTDTFGKDLVGHWKLDEASGSTIAMDSSIRGNDGTLIWMDPGTDWVPGRIGGALDLDGINDHVGVDHDPSLSLIHQLSVSAWIYASAGSLDAYHLVLSKGASASNQNYYLGTVDDEITFGFYNGALHEFNTSGEDLQPGTWYHIAATFNNANDSLRVYLNGSEVDSWTTTAQPLKNSDDLYIGRSQYGEYWNGRLDDIRIYNRTLDGAEIQALYDQAN